MKSGVVAVLIVLVAAGCTSGPAEPAPTAPVVLPGKPGEPGSVAPPDQAAQHRPRETPNAADVDYVTMMIPHHQQAIVMTDLAATRASDEQVRAIAGRIAATQGAEVKLMSDWLTRYGKPVPSGEHSEHMMPGMTMPDMTMPDVTMPGMATPQQLDALRAATGGEFDKRFLDLMIAHHQGALTMAEQQLTGGVETKAQELAQEVITGQSAEIERMRTLRAKL
jgi:uncharacterized protein (DUF305 family)